MYAVQDVVTYHNTIHLDSAITFIRFADNMQARLVRNNAVIQRFLFEKEFFNFFQFSNECTLVVQCCSVGKKENPRTLTLRVESIGALSGYTSKLITGTIVADDVSSKRYKLI